MAAISTWSTTAADNNSASPDGAPEGWAPSSVNAWGRETMASVRTWYEDAEWIDLGHTITYVSATSFTIAADVTTAFHANRRIRAVGSTTGTIYGKIDSSSFSSPDTTVTVTWVTGSLQNETLAISLSILAAADNAATSQDPDRVPGAGELLTSDNDVTGAGNSVTLIATTPSAFRRYVVLIDNVYPNVKDLNLWARVGDGSIYSGAGYAHMNMARGDDNTDYSTGSNGNAQWVISDLTGNAGAAANAYSGELVIIPQASGVCRATWLATSSGSTFRTAISGGGLVHGTTFTEVDRVQLLWSGSGTFSGGGVYLYGIR